MNIVQTWLPERADTRNQFSRISLLWIEFVGENEPCRNDHKTISMKLTGRKLTSRTIKTDPATKRIPVVIVTSSREDPDITAAYELGANGYVVKPVEFEAFSHSMIQTGIYWLTINETAR